MKKTILSLIMVGAMTLGATGVVFANQPEQQVNGNLNNVSASQGDYKAVKLSAPAIAEEPAQDNNNEYYNDREGCDGNGPYGDRENCDGNGPYGNGENCDGNGPYGNRGNGNGSGNKYRNNGSEI